MKEELKFGNNLMLLRSKHNISQQQLADKINVTRQTISTWENGFGNPDIYTVDRICKFFNVSMDVLVNGTVLNNPIITTDPVKILRYIDNNDTTYADFEEEDFIANFTEPGYYWIDDEELERYVGLIKYYTEHVLTTALALKEMGYMILDIKTSGFSVYLRDENEIEQFKKDIFNIAEDFIHGDNEYIQSTRKRICENLCAANEKVVSDALEELLGRKMAEIKYFWVDENELVRGYASKKSLCHKQAREQACEKYTVLDLIR